MALDETTVSVAQTGAISRVLNDAHPVTMDVNPSQTISSSATLLVVFGKASWGTAGGAADTDFPG